MSTSPSTRPSIRLALIGANRSQRRYRWPPELSVSIFGDVETLGERRRVCAAVHRGDFDIVIIATFIGHSAANNVRAACDRAGCPYETWRRSMRSLVEYLTARFAKEGDE